MISSTDLFDLTGEHKVALDVLIDIIDRDERIAKHFEEHRNIDLLLESHKEISQFDDKVVFRVFESVLAAILDKSNTRFVTEFLDDKKHRIVACVILGCKGLLASDSIPKLVFLASGTGGYTRYAKNAIVRIGNAEEEVLKSIRQSIIDRKDDEFRQLCVLAVNLFMSDNSEFIQAIFEGSQSESEHIREVVVDVIELLPPSSRLQFLDVLRKLANDSNINVSQAAFQALETISRQ